ncbi:hypothetical protein JFT91_23375 [Pseudomonas sp. TH08]|uniref:hypothetical protein n=1 Tax=unclassified Pseudomonas TaxID=196821 RepID=UPI00191296E7|nr:MULTISPECIES: hypothetical protein [unclassified Pseudomonas]MBK5530636.1 hypothetical protein [Pseudomonas sp. TH06]MBK5535480.1 hypothetical protein [Pseudomonas sp. TH08]
MTKKYSAHIIAIDPIIEESVLLSVQGLTVRCFVGFCPSIIEVGKTYGTEFEMVLPDELYISKMDNEERRVEMSGDGFSCNVCGYLAGETLQSFVDFSDQGIHFDYPHLNEQFVKITAERIDVSF